MATFIKVSVGGSELLRRNREQVQGNRLQKVEDDEQQRTGKEAVDRRAAALLAQGLGADGKPLDGGKRRQGARREEPAAFRVPDVPGFAFGLIAHGTGVGGSSILLRVYSGDTSIYLEQRHATPAITTNLYISPSIVYLPISKDACIAVVSVYSSYPSNPNSYPTFLFRKAYTISRQTVKEIQVPSAISAALDMFNSPWQVDQQLYWDYFLDPHYIQREGNGFLPTPSLAGWTPQIFQALNNLAPFVSSSSIISYPHGYRLVVTDWRYSFVSSSDPKNGSLYFANWSGSPTDIDTTRPDLLAPLPRATIELPQGWHLKPFDISVGDRNQTFSYSSAVAWNWDKPSYCRRMCLALGFSPADLMP